MEKLGTVQSIVHLVQMVTNVHQLCHANASIIRIKILYSDAPAWATSQTLTIAALTFSVAWMKLEQASNSPRFHAPMGMFSILMQLVAVREKIFSTNVLGLNAEATLRLWLTDKYRTDKIVNTSPFVCQMQIQKIREYLHAQATLNPTWAFFLPPVITGVRGPDRLRTRWTGRNSFCATWTISFVLWARSVLVHHGLSSTRQGHSANQSRGL